MAQKIHEILAKRQNGRHSLKYGAASAALAVSLLAAPLAIAQEYSPGPSAGVPGSPGDKDAELRRYHVQPRGPKCEMVCGLLDVSHACTLNHSTANALGDAHALLVCG